MTKAITVPVPLIFLLGISSNSACFFAIIALQSDQILIAGGIIMTWKLPPFFHKQHKRQTPLTPAEHQALIQKLNHEFNDGHVDPPIPTAQIISPYEKTREIEQAENDSTFKH